MLLWVYLGWINILDGNHFELKMIYENKFKTVMIKIVYKITTLTISKTIIQTVDGGKLFSDLCFCFDFLPSFLYSAVSCNWLHKQQSHTLPSPPKYHMFFLTELFFISFCKLLLLLQESKRWKQLCLILSETHQSSSVLRVTENSRGHGN